jgi:ABC-type sugar transport system substrate-binding protein
MRNLGVRRKSSLVVVLLAVAFLVLVIVSPKAQRKVHTVGFVPPGLTSPFHVSMVDGATKEAKALGWDIIVQAPASESDYAGFVTIVQQLLEKGVDAISINPIGVPPAVTAVKAANAKGIPIFAHNFITPFPDPDARITSYIGYDQFTGAQHLAETTCDLLARKYQTTVDKVQGKVFILLGLDGFHAHRRTDGFKYGLQKKCPNVKVVGEQTAEWLRSKGSEVATIALQKYPDIDVFYGNSDEMDIGASLAAEKLGKKIGVDIFSVGIDGNPPTLDLLKEGKVSATLGVDPYNMGVTVVEAMEKVLNGEKVPQVLLTPSVVVTADNLSDYLAGKLWTDPVEGQLELDNGLPTGMAATPGDTAGSR